MPTFVLIPGIMGTYLTRNKKEIWPIFHGSSDEQARELTKEDAKIGNIIGNVQGFYKIYDAIVSFIKNNTDCPLQSFPYDWRIDLLTTAARLRKFLDGIEGRKVIIAHSMGGLIIRYLLESGNYRNDSISDVIYAATPHLGAPEALMRILGQTGLGCLSLNPANFAYMAGFAKLFPAGHQLMPAPGRSFFRTPPGWTVDLYNGKFKSTDVAFQYGVGRAAALHAGLTGRAPDGVKYHCFYGDSIGDTRVAVDLIQSGKGLRINPKQPSDCFALGDGTVPIWSSSTQRIAWSTSTGCPSDHIGVASDGLLLKFLGQLAGRPTTKAVAPTLTLNSRVFLPRSLANVVIDLRLSPSKIDGHIAISSTDEPEVMVGDALPVSTAAATDFLSLWLPMPSKAGRYTVKYVDSKQNVVHSSPCSVVTRESVAGSRKRSTEAVVSS